MPTTFNTALSALLKAEVAWSYDNALANSTTQDHDTLRYSSSLSNGTAAQQADLLWHDRRTVTAGSPNDDLDLAGTLLDVFGQTIALAKLKGLLIRNLSTTSTDKLKVGGAGSGGHAIAELFASDPDATLVIPGSGCLFLTAPLDGFAITAGSQDVLRVTHDGGASDISYDILLLGTSA